MGANTFGTCFRISTFGESHGVALGVVVDGCPAGVPFSWDLLRKRLRSRSPGRFPWMSSRKEPDQAELLSGVWEGYTLGTPIAMLVKNQDARPQDYTAIKAHPRPGHADDVWKHKFGHTDHRGGGRASGRETVGRVLGGSVAEMFLKKLFPSIHVVSVPLQIGTFVRSKTKEFQGTKGTQRDQNFEVSEKNWFGPQTQEVEQYLRQAQLKGFSFGGSIQVQITGVPVALGQPVFHKLKSDLASAFMGVGACYSVLLGEDPDICLSEGSALHKKGEGVYGGIRGGISTGEAICFRLQFKPPASVLQTARQGRHDPCIVPRINPVIQAMAWLVLADHVLWSRLDRI